MQPSGNLHLGNYLGAIQHWVKLQDEYEAIFCVVDLHAITVPQEPAELRKKTIEVAKIYLAAGIDPKKSTMFIQSHVKEHVELAWILNTITKNGDLTKMTQFKDKSGMMDIDEFENRVKNAFQSREEQEKLSKLIESATSNGKNLSAEQISKFVGEASRFIMKQFQSDIKIPFNSSTGGLFDYPVLMAADILLYDTNIVPVGKDQMQHIELTRTLAKRFNDKFGKTFVIPEGKLSKEGALIMGLDDPTKKMSKSASSEYNYIALTDDAETVRKKIKKAVTDSGSEIVYSDGKPALKNLLNIYALLSDKKLEAVAGEYAGKGYADFKTDLAEVIVNFLTLFQERLKNVSDEEVLTVLKAGAEKVKPLAREKMHQVFDKIGLISY